LDRKCPILNDNTMFITPIKQKCKAITEGSQILRQLAYEGGKVVSHMDLQEIFLVLVSVKRLSQPQDHNAAWRILLMKNSSDTIGNQTYDLVACSTVPQPTPLPQICQ
jgi:hypothetical protein